MNDEDPETRLVTEGEPSDAFYALLEGQAHVTAGNDRLTATELAAGDHFGEIERLDAGPRTVNVGTLTEVRLLRVPGDTFIDTLLDSAPAPAFLDTSRPPLANTHPTRALAAAALAHGRTLGSRQEG